MTQLACAPLESLVEHLRRGNRLTVLTGAGCSTDSGIPDYRDANGDWKHARPVMFADFMANAAVRQRYWARSMLGWPRMANAEPGNAHHVLVSMQRDQRIHRLITQNVDGLHQKAGSSEVIDLHGRLDEVRCQSCATITPRADWQAIIARLNPDWFDKVAAVRDAPDGDAIIENANYDDFIVADCPNCGGIVKPEVVFFGENVPRERVADSYSAIDDSDGLLVVGSSLMVFSGFRFARRCHELGKPLFIINQGKTRADTLTDTKIDANCGAALQRVREALADLAS